MRAIVILLMGALLSACASTVETEQPYAPPTEIRDAAQWSRDISDCRGYALAYRRGLSPKAIGEAAAKGGASDLSSVPINALIPVLGAAGAGTSETLEELGLTDIGQQRVFVKCLDRKTEKDHSALELEPNP